MFGIAEMFSLAAAVVVGILLGGFYFGGLWWTLRRALLVGHPLPLYFASLVVRTAVVLLTLYGVIAFSGCPQAVACLAGFVTIRIVLVRRLGYTCSTDALQQEAI